VKSWPAGAWLAVYGIELKSLFGEKIMQKVDYIVTFMGITCGGRHPLTVKTNSFDVSGAICAATESIVDDRIKATNLVLISVVPDSYPPATDNMNSDGLLKPCPFCGNPNVSLVEPCLKMVTKIPR
jgi:hypothetical protein